MRKNPRRIFLPLRLSPPPSGVRGLDYPFAIRRCAGVSRRCPSSLYTFPFSGAWLGIAIAGFPEFEQFCIAGFPASTQACLSPQRLPFRHARMAGD